MLNASKTKLIVLFSVPFSARGFKRQANRIVRQIFVQLPEEGNADDAKDSSKVKRPSVTTKTSIVKKSESIPNERESRKIKRPERAIYVPPKKRRSSSSGEPNKEISGEPNKEISGEPNKEISGKPSKEFSIITKTLSPVSKMPQKGKNFFFISEKTD